MSLHTAIHKLNNQLISLFATVDAWCDRGPDFVITYEKLNASPRDIIVKFVNLNTHILHHLELLVKHEEQGTDFQSKTLLALIAQSELKPDVFTNKQPEELRDILREQLFQYLCLIDKFHNKRLDVSLSLKSPEFGRGLDIIQSLTKHVTDTIGKQELQFELK